MGYTLMADLIAAGQEFGIFEFYLPWIIMFSIFWALLSKIKLFGDPTKDKTARMVNLIISLGGSMYIMANTALGVSFAAFLSGLFGGTFMSIMAIISFVSVVYVMAAVAKGGDPFEAKIGKKKVWPFIAMLTVIAAVIFALSVYISSSGTALFPGFVLPGFEVPSIPTIVLPSINLSSQDLAMFFLFAVTALIVVYVTWIGKGETAPPARRQGQQ